MKILIYIAFCFIAAFIFSCTKNHDDARKKELINMQKQLNNSKNQLYQSMKIALRSTSVAGQNPKLDDARQNMFLLVGSLLNTASVALDTSKNGALNPIELVTLAKHIYDTKEVLLKTDEDSLPTLLENICFVFNNSKTISSPYLPKEYNNNYEHVILALLWQLTPSAPKDFAMYEVLRSDEKNIHDMATKLIYQLTKSFVLLENNYYYHSFDKTNEYLSLLENNKTIVSEEFRLPNSNKESGYYTMHGMGLIIRALDEREMGEEKESINDMESFLGDMEKAGLDNELTWLVRVNVSIHKDEYEKAIPALEKLQNSKLLSDPEKMAIAELLTFAKNRKKDKDLNIITDKLAFTKIAFHLFEARLRDSKIVTDLTKSKEGKKLVQVQQEMNSMLQFIESSKNYLNSDSLAAKTKGIINKLFE